MSQYKHLSIKERENILVLMNNGKSISEISRILNRSKSTISREIKRNSTSESYSAVEADKLYQSRRVKCRRKKILSNIKIKEKILDLFLNTQWSPEEISKRLKYENSKYKISYATIYRGIYDGTLEPVPLSHGQRGIAKKLRHRGKTRHKKGTIETRGKIVISNSIEDRSNSANDRSEKGHWEADSVAGKIGSECLVSLADRCSRFLLACKSPSKSSYDVKETMIKLLKSVGMDMVKSITPDRGKEFARHSEVTAALGGVEFYFPPPHSPWLRGTNENTNGLLREYLPKGVDMKLFTDEQIDNFVFKLNTRPRKCLGWKTPFEVFFNVVLHLT